MYCEKCKCLFDGEGRCPECNSKKTRAVRDDDICLLTERPLVLSGLLEEVLRQNDIPFMTKGRLGAGLTLAIGAFIETTRFYVPYPCYTKASELVSEIFAATDYSADDEDFVIDDEDYEDKIDYDEE